MYAKRNLTLGAAPGVSAWAAETSWKLWSGSRLAAAAMPANFSEVRRKCRRSPVASERISRSSSRERSANARSISFLVMSLRYIAVSPFC
jgi:hypothetical protein